MVNADTLDRLSAIVPPALAESPPPRGPSLRERRRYLISIVRQAPHLSDRNIAAWCNVSRQMVAGIRQQMMACGAIGSQSIRLGLDGKRYKIEAKP